MYIYAIIAPALLLAVLAIAVARQPKEFRVARSITVAAPPAEVFARFNDFHAWEAWSPWAKMDPNARNTYEGPASGPGAVYSWTGNRKVGAGRMTILESRPDEFIKIKLEFQRPMKCVNTAEFTFRPEGRQTHVNWTMYGTNLLMGKIMGLFLNMDKMVGSDFEKGLAGMKALAEAPR